MASRNRKEMNRKLFGLLVDSAEAKGIFFSNSRSDRWLKNSNDDQSDFMAKADVIHKLNVSNIQKALIASHAGERTLVLVGFDQIDQPPAGLSPVPVSAAVLSLAVTALSVEPTASGDSIRDALESYFLDQNDRDENDIVRYKGHEVGDILPLFPHIEAFSINDNYLYTKNLERCVGLYVCYGSHRFPLAIKKGLSDKMVQLFESGSEYIPYHNVLQGVLSFSWTAFYLDMYRCIERLFLIPRVSKLAVDLKSEVSILDYCRYLETHLSWRPKEEEALRMLLTQCDNNNLLQVLEAFDVLNRIIDDPENKGKVAEKAASAVYKLRNDIVHFRPANEVVEFASEQWNKIMESLVSIMLELYLFYQRELEGTGAGAASSAHRVP